MARNPNPGESAGVEAAAGRDLEGRFQALRGGECGVRARGVESRDELADELLVDVFRTDSLREVLHGVAYFEATERVWAREERCRERRLHRGGHNQLDATFRADQRVRETCD